MSSINAFDGKGEATPWEEVLMAIPFVRKFVNRQIIALAVTRMHVLPAMTRSDQIT
jgi:hypothetical protein